MNTLELVQTIATALGWRIVGFPCELIIYDKGTGSWRIQRDPHTMSCILQSDLNVLGFLKAAEGALTEGHRLEYEKAMYHEWMRLPDNDTSSSTWFYLTARTEVRLATLAKVLEGTP